MIRILIIANSALMQVTLSNILEKNKYNVVGYANNESDSLSKYLEVSPDVIIIDMTMEDVDSISIIKKIINHDITAIFVVIASNEQRLDIIEAIRVGAKEVIIKPIKEPQIIDILKKILG